MAKHAWPFYRRDRIQLVSTKKMTDLIRAEADRDGVTYSRFLELLALRELHSRGIVENEQHPPV